VLYYILGYRAALNKMLKYHFVTEWSFKAPVERVWEVIKDAESMPAWWPGLKKCQIRGDDKTLKVGTLLEAAVKGLLGDLNFTLEVSEIEPHKRLLLKSSGDLRGIGLWTLAPDGDGTRTRFLWEITTTGWLMNLVGLLFKPLLARNHDRVMAAGYKALKSRIEG